MCICVSKTSFAQISIRLVSDFLFFFVLHVYLAADYLRN